jgi:acetamidase/formamidase
VEFLQNRKHLDFSDALSLCSLSVDFEVTEIVDGTKGIHSLVAKSLFKHKPTPYWYQPKLD